MEQPSFLQDYTALAQTAMMAVTVYLTVLSAYLFTAYTAGAKLTRGQNLLISLLFFTFASAFTFTTWGFMNGATTLYQARLDDGSTQGYLTNAVAFCEAAGIVGALMFMRNIRHANLRK